MKAELARFTVKPYVMVSLITPHNVEVVVSE
jgi:hypothetical protein